MTICESTSTGPAALRTCTDASSRGELPTFWFVAIEIKLLSACLVSLSDQKAMVRMAGVVLMIGFGWISARAQRLETAPAYAPLEISFGYSYARSNAGPGLCSCFNMIGGSSEVAVHAFRALSMVADLTGERAPTIGAAPGDGSRAWRRAGNRRAGAGRRQRGHCG